MTSNIFPMLGIAAFLQETRSIVKREKRQYLHSRRNIIISILLYKNIRLFYKCNNILITSFGTYKFNNKKYKQNTWILDGNNKKFARSQFIPPDVPSRILYYYYYLFRNAIRVFRWSNYFILHSMSLETCQRWYIYIYISLEISSQFVLC